VAQIDDTVAEFLGRALRGEARTNARLARSYARGLPELRRRLRRFEVAMAAADRSGGLTTGWVMQEARLRDLLTAVEAHVGRFAAAAGTTVNAATIDATVLGVRAAVNLAPVTLAPLPGSEQVVARLVGAGGAGSPLRPILAQLAPGAVEAVTDTVVGGVTAGRPVRAIARDVADGFGAPLRRAQLVVRTETMRAYREGQRAVYEAHPDVPEWMWVAALDGRSCAACWAKHGSRFPSSTRQAAHPGCRCVMVPVVAGDSPPVTPGPVAFAAADPDVQERVLGGAAHRAYTAGAVRLEDLVGVRSSPVWGESVSVKSLRQAIGGDGARRFYRR
jgi:SPP1 gp7 family putative phage head morphogenesis protein